MLLCHDVCELEVPGQTYFHSIAGLQSLVRQVPRVFHSRSNRAPRCFPNDRNEIKSAGFQRSETPWSGWRDSNSRSPGPKPGLSAHRIRPDLSATGSIGCKSLNGGGRMRRWIHAGRETEDNAIEDPSGHIHSKGIRTKVTEVPPSVRNTDSSLEIRVIVPRTAVHASWPLP